MRAVDITPLVPGDRQLIQGYGEGGFRIANVRYDGAVLVLPDRTVPWLVDGIDAVTLHSLAPLHAPEADVEILLVGCGRSLRRLPETLRQGLRGWGIVADPMDTGAACRTYNVLLSEDRRVAAALLPIM